MDVRSAADTDRRRLMRRRSRKNDSRDPPTEVISRAWAAHGPPLVGYAGEVRGWTDHGRELAYRATIGIIHHPAMGADVVPERPL
jgi:hypothetical protein